MASVNEGFSLLFPKKVCNAGYPIGDPKELLKKRGSVSYESPNRPWNWCDNVQATNYGDRFELVEYQAKVPGGYPYQTVTQDLSADGKAKLTTIKPENFHGRGHFEMVQTLAEDGTYECRRIGNGVEHVKQIKPIEGRKALTGLKGKLEKAFMTIAQDANGCERPVLKRISGTAIKILRRIK